jgi:hypothetical protein
MAFASVGSLGSGGSVTANQSTLVLTTTATLEAGNLGVIIIGVDNNQTTDGDEGAVSGVVDSAGNTWVKGAEFTNGQGTAQAGATCSIWYCVVPSQLTSGGTITASFTNNTSRDASAITAWEFTLSGTVAVEGTPGTLANDGSDLASLNVTTSNIECLRIRGAAIERGADTLSAVTSGWTNITPAGDSGGGANQSNVSAVGEFIISTATGAASDPTLTTNQDGASIYIAFKEVATNKTLAAGAGSYTITGTNASLLVKRVVAAGVGSYAITGTAAALTHQWKVAAGSGSYALTGTAASLLHGWKVAAGAGSYTLNGTAATLLKTSRLSAAAGSYTLTGTAAALLVGHVVSVNGGSYVISGSAAILSKTALQQGGGDTSDGDVDPAYYDWWRKQSEPRKSSRDELETREPETAKQRIIPDVVSAPAPSFVADSLAAPWPIQSGRSAPVSMVNDQEKDDEAAILALMQAMQ